MKVPVMYARKSTKGGPDSKDDQIEGARELAARIGETAPLHVLDGDWGISAAEEKTAKRLDFMTLLRMVEDDEVSAIYATDADRLARSVRWAAQLGDLCRAKGVKVHTPVRSFDFDEEADWTIWTFAALTNEAEVKKLSRKANARVKRTNERIIKHIESGCPSPDVCGKWSNHRMGQPDFGWNEGEDAAAVVAALRQAGTLHGAARLLIEQGVPSRRSHLTTPEGVPLSWSATTVQRIVQREAPELIPTRRKQGRRIIATRLFTQLLQCPHDDSFLTPQHIKAGAPGWVCRIGHREPGAHPRPYALREHVVTKWVKQEVRYHLTLHAKVEDDEGVEGDIEEVRAKLVKLGLLYVDGVFPEHVYLSKKAELDAEMDRLNSLTRTHQTWMLGVDWTMPVGDINAKLHDLMHSIRLGYVESNEPVRGRHASIKSALVPVGAVWRRQPTIETDDGEAEVPHPDAVQVSGGWYLPSQAA